MADFLIREVTVADAQVTLDIYAHYVETTAASFDYVPPSVEDWGKHFTKPYSID